MHVEIIIWGTGIEASMHAGSPGMHAEIWGTGRQVGSPANGMHAETWGTRIEARMHAGSPANGMHVEIYGGQGLRQACMQAAQLMACMWRYMGDRD